MKNLTTSELCEVIFPISDRTTNAYLKKAFDLIAYRQVNVLPIIPKKRRLYPEQEVQKHHIVPKHVFALYGLQIDNSLDNLVKLTILEHFKIHLWYGFYFQDIKDTIPDSKFKEEIIHMMYGNIWSAQRIIAKRHMSLEQLAALTDTEILNFRNMYSDCQSRSTKCCWENRGEEYKKHVSEFKRNWWKTLDVKKKEEFINKRLETINSLPQEYKNSYNKTIGKKNKEAWKRKSKEEKQAFIEKCKILRRQERLRKTPEQKKHESEVLSAALKGEISVSNDITHHCTCIKDDVIEAFLLNGYVLGNHVRKWKAMGYTYKINGIWYKDDMNDNNILV